MTQISISVLSLNETNTELAVNRQDEIPKNVSNSPCEVHEFFWNILHQRNEKKKRCINFSIPADRPVTSGSSDSNDIHKFRRYLPQVIIVPVLP